MSMLKDYLKALKARPGYKSIEPELKAQRQDHDKKIREEQDIAAGAVLQAVISKGDGSDSPKSGDLVYVHFSVRLEGDEDPVFSTRSDEGGSGQAFGFRVEKGKGVPRAWEIVVKDMSRGERRAMKVRPDYGFQHPECQLAAPKDVPASETLSFDFELLNWYPSSKLRQAGVADQDIVKRVLVDGFSWENPRAPFEVTFHMSAYTPSSTGVQLSGFRYFQSPQQAPLTVHLGQNELPAGVEEAISSLSPGEKAVLLVPAEHMGVPEGGRCLMQAPPARATQVELEIELVSMVQVRDMTGTGEVMKKRLRDGVGDFPMDAPLNDTTVSVHYRVRPVRDGVAGEWVYDTRSAGSSRGSQPARTSSSTGGDAESAVIPSARTSDEAGKGEAATVGESMAAEGRNKIAQAEDGGEGTAGASKESPPLEFDTGCGEAPQGLELAVKLMLPGELASVVCAPSHAYRGRGDAPSGIIAETDTVEFELELVSFVKEGHWQVMAMADRFALAERTKAKANELYKAGKHNFARQRYEHMAKLLDSIRDYQTQEEATQAEALRVTMLSNLALCATAMGDYPAAVEACQKALKQQPDNAKVLFRLGRALSLKGCFEEAAEALAEAAEADPESARDVAREVAANNTRRSEAEKKQRQELRNFLKR